MRSKFTSYDQITAEDAEQLPYLRGVVDEAMRMLPPSPLGGMRTSPGTMIDEDYVPKGVSTSCVLPLAHGLLLLESCSMA